MDLEYYTLEQAARRLDCRLDEIEHHIETGKLRSHLYCYDKNFIILNPHPNYSIARGIARYTGLIEPHHSFILLAFNRKEIVINRRITLKNLSGLSSWQGRHNFESDLYKSETGITKWVPERQDSLGDEKEVPAIALPHEGPGLMKMALGILNSMKKSETEDEDFNPNAPPDFSYSFWTNGTFKKADIKITHEDLAAFKQFSQPTKTLEIPLIERNVTSETPTPSYEGKRINELHQLLKSILATYSDANAHELWRILQHEVESSSREYDSEEILNEVTSDAIHWTSSYGNDSTLARSSFPSTISQLKKQLQPPQ